MQFLAHGFFKAACFWGGACDRTAHTMDLNKLGGLSRKMPYTAASFTIAAVTLPECRLLSACEQMAHLLEQHRRDDCGLQVFVIVVLAGSVSPQATSSARRLAYSMVSFRPIWRRARGPRTMLGATGNPCGGVRRLGVFAQYPLAIITQVPYAEQWSHSPRCAYQYRNTRRIQFAPALAAILLLTAILAGLILNEFLTRRPRETLQHLNSFRSGYELPEGYVYASGRHILYQVTQPFERLRWIDPDYAYAAIGRGADSLSRWLRRHKTET